MSGELTTTRQVSKERSDRSTCLASYELNSRRTKRRCRLPYQPLAKRLLEVLISIAALQITARFDGVSAASASVSCSGARHDVVNGPRRTPHTANIPTVLRSAAAAFVG